MKIIKVYLAVLLLFMICLTGYIVKLDRDIQVANREAEKNELKLEKTREMYDGFLAWLWINEIEFDTKDHMQMTRLWNRYLKTLIPEPPKEDAL
jgi:hypothetical protein